MAVKQKDTMQDLFWERVPGADDYFDRARQVGKTAGLRFAIMMGATLLCVALGIWTVMRAHNPSPVRVVEDHRYFTGTLTAPKPVSAADLQQQMEDTIEALLTRTEKGSVPALADYVEHGVIEWVNANYNAAKDIPGGFLQTCSITNSRILKSSPNYIVFGVRAFLSSKTISGYQLSPVYFVAGFSFGKSTDANQLGLRLVKFSPDPNGDTFFSKEHAQAKAERLQN